MKRIKFPQHNKTDNITAVLVKSQDSEIFQVGKRNIINQNMIDNWGNAKTALPHHF
jgi:hypothetical protein